MASIPRSLTRICRLLVLVGLGVLTSVRVASAQITVVPTFPVGPSPLGEAALNTEVAVAPDGSMLFAWTGFSNSEPHVSTRHMSAAGLALAPPQIIGTYGYARKLVTDPNGGYVLAADDGGIAIGAAFGRMLNAAGTGVAPTFLVSDVATGGVTSSAVAALPTGAVFVWEQNGQFLGRLFDDAGQALGPSFVIENDAGGAGGKTLAVAATPDGGFVAAWSWFAVGLVARARVYDASGQPETPAVDVGIGNAVITRVAASPLGGFMVTGFRFGAGFDQPTEVMAFRFSDGAAALGTSTLAVLPSGVVGLSDLAFDSAGNALVVWTEFQFVGPSPGYLRNRGRGVLPDGTPLAGPFLIAEAPVEQVRTAASPADTFVNAWATQGDVVGNVVRLCTPAVATCGDGLPVAQCEECDEGAANSDTTPDACRTDCRLPRCGDGIADVAHGEECDDQNGERCDGCTPECRLEIGLVCGDGAVVPGCGDEQCDDANPTVGDGCDPGCTLEPVPGGGNPATDCDVAWTVDNPANVPLLDKHGAFNGVQLCADGDPRCDFDAGTAGSCTFHVQVCANLTGLERCEPPTRLASWELRTPSASAAAKKPALAAARAAFAPVVGTIVGPDERNVCTGWLAVPVPLRPRATGYAVGKLTLKAAATTYDDDRDTDKLKLVCLPAAP